MHSYTYPFVVFEYEDGSSDQLAHPYLPLRISNPYSKDELQIIWGLVDTGADSCLLPASLAESLGHDLKGDGVRATVNMGIEQKSIPVYAHTFNIGLLSPDHRKIVWESGNVEVECSETEPPVLIGVQNFLKHFRLTVDYPKREFTLSWK